LRKELQTLQQLGERISKRGATPDPKRTYIPLELKVMQSEEIQQSSKRRFKAERFGTLDRGKQPMYIFYDDEDLDVQGDVSMNPVSNIPNNPMPNLVRSTSITSGAGPVTRRAKRKWNQDEVNALIARFYAIGNC